MSYTLTTSPQQVGINTTNTMAVKLLAWYTDQSGNSATVHLKLQACSQGIGYSGTNKNYSMSLGTYNTGTVNWPNTMYADTWYDVAEITQSFNGTAQVTCNATFWTYVYGSTSVSASSAVYMPAFGDPPTDGSITGAEASWDSVNNRVNVTATAISVTSALSLETMQWCVSSVPFTTNTTPRRLQNVANGGSGLINNSSTASGGGITILPNGQYYVGIYAKNSAGSYRYSSDTMVETPPAPATLEVESTTGTAATVRYIMPSDGGLYAKTIQYSIDGGETWVVGPTVTGSTAETGTFTITGLQKGTLYLLNSKVMLANGLVTDNIAISFYSYGPASSSFYGSVNSETTAVTNLYGSVNSQTAIVIKVYGSEEGVTKRIY